MSKPIGGARKSIKNQEGQGMLDIDENSSVEDDMFENVNQYSTAGEHGTRELKVSEEIFGSNFLSIRESSITTGIFWYCGIMTLQKESRIPPMCGKGNTL